MQQLQVQQLQVKPMEQLLQVYAVVQQLQVPQVKFQLQFLVQHLQPSLEQLRL